MAKVGIADPRVRVRPSQKLVQFINQHKDSITKIPENVSKILESKGYNIPSQIDLLKADESLKQQSINLKLLRDIEEDITLEKTDTKLKSIDAEDGEDELNNFSEYLYLSDLRWLSLWLTELRKEKGLNLYLHNLLEHCFLELPKNEVMERNPQLEARCQRLREQQQNKEYLDMTKNVDARLKHVPEDTLAYQVKAMNSQMIGVFQFVLSVAAGFVFGFLGLELIFGGLEFGLRLVLGIFCALVIGVAEMYFLIKKLNEEEKALSSLKKSTKPVKKTDKAFKPHNE